MSVAAPLLTRVRADGLARRVVRCFSVSVLTTGLSLVTLAALTAGFAVTAWIANVGATALGTVVSYRLNRSWVWHRSEASDLWREVLPFWTLSFAGLILSTVFVAVADRSATAAHLAPGVHTGVVLVASVAGYAALWLAEFVVLERVLFAGQPRALPVCPARPDHEEPAR